MHRVDFKAKLFTRNARVLLRPEAASQQSANVFPMRTWGNLIVPLRKTMKNIYGYLTVGGPITMGVFTPKNTKKEAEKTKNVIVCIFERKYVLVCILGTFFSLQAYFTDVFTCKLVRDL